MAFFSAISIFLHEVPHQVGDFFVMLKRGFSTWAVLVLQLLSGSGSFVGGAISQMIPEKYKLALAVFSMISFAFTIFNSILNDLLDDTFGLSLRHLALECAMIALGFFTFSLIED